jgi:hypothetical protein
MAAGRGICLWAQRGMFTTFHASLFGEDLQPRQTIDLAGIPSRARVSPDGRYAAFTVFVTGHSYAGGAFSTKTSIVDAASGAVVLDDLEQLTVLRDGAPIQAPDFNFWGVTFAQESNRFYATLATGGQTSLIEGDIAARQARVIHDNVECPSLSPDNSRVAFKRRGTRDGHVVWQIVVLDLATRAETPLALEARSVDDQVEWLDDRAILYALPAAEGAAGLADVWMLAADGTQPPRLLLPAAESPAVLR